MIGAGALDRRVTLQRATVVRDPDYNSVVATEWNDVVADIPASVRQTSGNEYLEAGQIVAQRKVTFTIRWMSDVRVTDRIEWESRSYGVVAVNEIGRRRFLEIFAEDVS